MAREPIGMDSVSRAIGSLESHVKNLTQAVESQGRVASNSRKAVYDRLAIMQQQLGSTAGKVDVIQDVMAGMKPSIDAFERARQQQIGKASLMKVLWGGMVMFFTGLGYVLHEVFAYFKSNSH